MKGCLVELLLLANKDHDKEAIEIIVTRFSPLLRKVAHMLDYDGAESDLIIYLIETIYSLNVSKVEKLSEGQAVNYIARIIKNKGIDIHRRMRSQLDEIHTECLVELSDRYFETDNVWEYLEFLDKKQRIVVSLKYYYGYSDVEIGNKLGISRQAVNKTNRKALEKIRNIIGGI